MRPSRRVQKRASALVRRALPVIAVSCAALAAPLAAQAQRVAGDPARCGDPHQAERLRAAILNVEGAQHAVRIHTAFVNTVLAMSPAQMREASVVITQAIDREQAAVRQDPDTWGRRGLIELGARRDLLLEGMLNAEIGTRTDPERNAYSPLMQQAKDQVRLAYSDYIQAMAACGQTPSGADVAPITGYRQPEAYTDTRPLTNRPTGGAAPPSPPTVSTGNSAGGRIKFKPMSDQDARQMANAVAPNGPLTGAAADLSSWGGSYSDGVQSRYTLTPAGAYMAVVGGMAVGGGTILLNWDDCRISGAGVMCNLKGEVRNPNDGVEIAGTVTASRSGGVVSGTYTFSGVKVLWGRTTNIAAGQTIRFSYLPF